MKHVSTLYIELFSPLQWTLFLRVSWNQTQNLCGKDFFILFSWASRKRSSTRGIGEFELESNSRWLNLKFSFYWFPQVFQNFSLSFILILSGSLRWIFFPFNFFFHPFFTHTLYRKHNSKFKSRYWTEIFLISQFLHPSNLIWNDEGKKKEEISFSCELGEEFFSFLWIQIEIPIVNIKFMLLENLLPRLNLLSFSSISLAAQQKAGSRDENFLNLNTKISRVVCAEKRSWWIKSRFLSFFYESLCLILWVCEPKKRLLNICVLLEWNFTDIDFPRE